MLHEKFFTAVPYNDGSMVLNLRTAYQEKVKKNLLTILSTIAETFNVDLAHFVKYVEDLDVNVRFSSGLHSISVNLESAYAQNDFPKIVATLKLFQEFDKEAAYSGGLQFGTVYGDFYDEGIEELLRKQDDISKEYDGQQPEIHRLNDAELKEFLPIAKEAVERIKEADPSFFNEVDVHVSRIKLFRGQVVTGISGLITFGTVYLRLPKPEHNPLSYFVEHFTHETSHYHLHSLMGFDPLVLNSPDKRYPAPIRRDLRPIYGIYHAGFVLSRMVRVLSRLDQKYPNVFNTDLEKTKKQLASGITTIKAHAELTEKGKMVADSLEETAYA